MQYGSALPITAFADAGAVKAYAQTLEGAGFDFTSTSGHVMAQPPGTNPQRPDRQYVGPFYDPFVTFSHLAAVTHQLRFLTGILILPAWPTVLVAKQAAELALFSGGRFELGVGISWNAAEYQALGQNIRDRGRRIEEQIEVLRLLWSQPYVTFDGRYHKLDKVGLNRASLPRIPLWFGSESGETALRRVARLADGWMSLGDPIPDLPRLRQYMQEAGRDPATLMVRGPLMAGDGGEAAWIAAGKKLQAGGVTHINITAPLDFVPAQALARVAEARRVVAAALG
ncbi:MAG TPA: TIGR03619 family F420-dependent LLM class oxidoreductase [Acetobacteraceae bacterium]|jgi:probable F420-dependent oxidoreductase|nr:TIGR03619 family F420-dependent LLM class oxidoreductase [Acetobacteraceae bacterium]